MILGIEIAMIVVGLVALIRGKFTVTTNRVVEGIPARLLGLVALTPLPIALVIVMVYVLISNPRDPEQFVKDKAITVAVIEAATVIGIALFVFGIGAIIGEPPRKKKRRRRDEEYDDDDDVEDDYEDDEDDRPRPNKAYEVDDEDEMEDDRPRKRRRRDEYDDDDEEERPRRRR